MGKKRVAQCLDLVGREGARIARSFACDVLDALELHLLVHLAGHPGGEAARLSALCARQSSCSSAIVLGSFAMAGCAEGGCGGPEGSKAGKRLGFSSSA